MCIATFIYNSNSQKYVPLLLRDTQGEEGGMGSPIGNQRKQEMYMSKEELSTQMKEEELVTITIIEHGIPCLVRTYINTISHVHVAQLARA